MKRILFVCQANVGRSQMAEAFYNFHTNTKDATSAGVEDFRKKYHYRPTVEIIHTMLEKGIDISEQRIDLLNTEMVKRVDRIVVLCDKKLCPQFLLSSGKTIFREVQDPHQQSKVAIRQIRDQIESIILELIEDIKDARN